MRLNKEMFDWAGSPVEEIVHPKYIDLESRGGLGWLEGFNEWMVRCGLEFAGHPGEDTFTTNTGGEAYGPIPSWKNWKYSCQLCRSYRRQRSTPQDSGPWHCLREVFLRTLLKLVTEISTHQILILPNRRYGNQPWWLTAGIHPNLSWKLRLQHS